MISYNEALEIISQNSCERKIERMRSIEALGFVCAEDIYSQINVPSFNNSAMDGFAVKFKDLENASLNNQIKLPIIKIVAAGDNSQVGTISGAVQIMTGAIVPSGYDAVIPIEEVKINGAEVAFKRPARKNENIRFIGEDVSKDQKILTLNKVVSAEDIMLLHAVGIAEIEVYKKPKLYIFSTGNEITDDYKLPLETGQIYNSNSPYLIARATEEGLQAHYGGIIKDNENNFEQAIANIETGSIIITTGAVSKGKWDFIPETLKKLGAKIHFHRVNIRPGKPVLFASLLNGSYFFGLPGNPISSAIGFRFFVLPLIKNLQGLNSEQPIVAELKNNFVKKGNFKQFLKSNLEFADGKLFVTILDGQESFKISPMTEGNAWVTLDENIVGAKSGSKLSVCPYKSNSNFITITKEALCKAA